MSVFDDDHIGLLYQMSGRGSFWTGRDRGDEIDAFGESKHEAGLYPFCYFFAYNHKKNDAIQDRF